jgi:hypothetical protein
VLVVSAAAAEFETNVGTVATAAPTAVKLLVAAKVAVAAIVAKPAGSIHSAGVEVPLKKPILSTYHLALAGIVVPSAIQTTGLM